MTNPPDSPDTPLQPDVEDSEEGQMSGEENASGETYDSDFEILEQSALDSFTAILQKAQRIATEAEKKNFRKRAKTYDGKSERSQRRHKKCQKDFEKQGYPSMLKYFKPIEAPTNNSAASDCRSDGHLSVASDLDSDSDETRSARISNEHASVPLDLDSSGKDTSALSEEHSKQAPGDSESTPEKSDTKDPVLKHVGQVCQRELLIAYHSDQLMRKQPAAREEDEESKGASESESEPKSRDEDTGHPEALIEAALDTNDGTQRVIQELLEDLRCRCTPSDTSPLTAVEKTLTLLRDHEALSKAQEMLKQRMLRYFVIFTSYLH
jgi:hypothetical protein